MLGILDYNAGNPRSVLRALASQRIAACITNDPSELESADGIIFPGVGAAGSAMQTLTQSGLDTVLRHAVSRHQPLLGICLGCQILLTQSEENATPLLDIFPGSCRKFPDNALQEDGTPAPIPHMGWNTVVQTKPSPLFADIPQNAFFYFVHSYYVCPQADLVLAQSTYTHPFCVAFGRDGLWGVQFHPEKSGRWGLTLLANFARFCSQRGHHAQ
ncbi:MAG: imidazole glycerol phosphate synthase subunit HisH [Desulfovibrio sp.]|nr:imidazole glycerol phosphate synthase subunit HisH [Desulfovibrio sp.]